MIGRPPNQASDLWAKIAPGPADCCWEYTGQRNLDGYGVFKYQAKNRMAHRMAYQFAKGEPPKGMLVRHACDNPACCNPNHLSLGSDKDNADDRNSRGRQAKGSRNGSSKLIESQIIEIRSLLAKGTTVKAVAQRFGLGLSTVYAIKTRKAWRHLP